MSPQLSSWQSSGTFIPFGPFAHRIFVKQLGDANVSADRTLLLLHGFPESSFSYHKVLDGLSKIFDRIILFDMPGYGFSDKPTEGYTYSLMEQADAAFAVWQHFQVQGGHILAHDMGDSVLTEIVARHENGLLPGWFADGIRSLTFTNGSMVLDLAELRITQKLLLSRYGRQFNKITTYKVARQQIRSAHGNSNLSEEDIQLLWELNTQHEGHRKTYLTIRYLNDRKRFEKTRWLPALGSTRLPIHLCWGDADMVARVVMPHYLKENVCPQAQVTIMEGLGHFCQLGSPGPWVEAVSGFFSAHAFDD